MNNLVINSFLAWLIWLSIFTMFLGKPEKIWSYGRMQFNLGLRIFLKDHSIFQSFLVTYPHNPLQRPKITKAQ